MRALRIVLGFLLLTSTCAFADDIDSVVVSASFTGKPTCTANCSQTISVSFQIDVSPSALDDYWSTGNAWTIPGTLSVISSGPLGEFNNATGQINWGDNYLGFNNAEGDEIDIKGLWWLSYPDIYAPINAEIYWCSSSLCEAAGLAGGGIEPTFFYSSVTQVPEPNSLSLIAIAGVGLRFWKWRSKRH